MVWVDGTQMGEARTYDGKTAVLNLAPGKHEIVLRAEGYEEYRARVFLNNSQERIEINLVKK
jgi:hypothetical protein